MPLYRTLVLKKIEMLGCNIVIFTLHRLPIVKLEMSNADLFNEPTSTIYDSPVVCDGGVNKWGDISRTNDLGRDSYSVSDRSPEEFSSKFVAEENPNAAAISAIYRYKFTEELTVELFKFSKIHQYDHRKDFKEAWTIWLENNEYLVETEIRRLTNFGYIGNIRDKMFKSARYYLRKKSTEKKAPAERRNYVAVQKELLDAIDTHIKNIISRDSKPSDGFDDFCKNNKDILNDEIKSLCKNGMTDSNEIKNKIKKTYKNRHFLIVSK
jgi:hypothetical protein